MTRIVLPLDVSVPRAPQGTARIAVAEYGGGDLFRQHVLEGDPCNIGRIAPTHSKRGKSQSEGPETSADKLELELVPTVTAELDQSINAAGVLDDQPRKARESGAFAILFAPEISVRPIVRGHDSHEARNTAAFSDTLPSSLNDEALPMTANNTIRADNSGSWPLPLNPILTFPGPPAKPSPPATSDAKVLPLPDRAMPVLRGVPARPELGPAMLFADRSNTGTALRRENSGSWYFAEPRHNRASWSSVMAERPQIPPIVPSPAQTAPMGNTMPNLRSLGTLASGFYAVTTENEVPEATSISHVFSAGLSAQSQINVAAHWSGAAQSSIAQVAQAVFNATSEHFEISLSPEELGRVRFHLHQSETGLQISITAERPETLDLLRKNISLLSRTLSDLGYESASFHFGENGGDRKNKPGVQVPRSAQDTSFEQSSTITPAHVGNLLAGGLDLRF